MRCDWKNKSVEALILMLLTLTACVPQNALTPADVSLLAAPMQANSFCEACDQATLAAALTREKMDGDVHAAATAEIMRANAQATLNAANVTLSAAQTQDQNNANVIAAQIAATAEIVRANAQATINSANSTQSAAMTLDAIRQTQVANLATADAQSLLIQQNQNDLAASTQTAIANQIITQTQAAVATAQWYTDQDRQRDEQREGPIAFLWAWCLPMFILLFAGLLLWGVWRWLKIQQANQLILANPVDQLPAPVVEVKHHHHDDHSLPYIESDAIVIEGRSRSIKPDDQVSRWLEEVKGKLQRSDERDQNDDTDN